MSKVKTKKDISKPHGGARPGAGRKPKNKINRVQFTTTVHPDTKAAIEAQSEASGKSMGEVLDQLVESKLS